ncbi:ABC transporter ATP-binding protein [Leucobacter sp. GX0328]
MHEPASVLSASNAEVVIDGAVLLPPTSIALDAGRSVAVRGPNGAGKTTLLRVIAGRLRPSGGTVSLFGGRLDDRDPAVRTHIAALIEPPVLYPDLTVHDHLALIEAAWEAAGAGAGPAPAWLGLGSTALDRFGLTGLAERFPNELSSGQRQLVSLAVTFARPATVLLLDEPEQRLDPDRRSLVADALLDARTHGAAIAFASHDAALVARVADAETVVGEPRARGGAEAA